MIYTMMMRSTLDCAAVKSPLIYPTDYIRLRLQPTPPLINPVRVPQQAPDRSRIGLQLAQKRRKVLAQLVPEAVLV